MITARPQKNLQTAKEYFRKHLAQGDYYSEGQTVAGRWFGQGVARLGLDPAAPVTEAAFVRLCDNQHPATGERLTARQRRLDRRVFHDFVVSAPKSVSVLAYVVGDTRLITAHDEAAHAALARMEQVAATRVGKGGPHADRRTGEVIAAVFRHDTSRALDPQLHTHYVMFNATWDAVEGRWKALQTSQMFDQMTFFTEIYRSELARRVVAMGYGLRNTAHGFEIEGVSQDLLDRFSKRRRAILAAEEKTLAELNEDRRRGLEAAVQNSPTPEARAAAEKALRAFVPVTQLTNTGRSTLAHSTRAQKTDHLTSQEVLTQQREQLRPGELEALRRLASPGDAPRRAARTPGQPIAPTITAAEAIDYARDHLFERHSVVHLHRLWKEALAYTRGFVTLPDLEAELAKHHEFLTVDEMLTTKETLRQEERLVTLVNQGMGRARPLNAAFAGDPNLKDDQPLALRHLLRAPDLVVGLRGGAGTGKSTLLCALVKAIEERQPAIVLAPTTAAVESLRKDGLARAATVQRFLTDPEFQARARGQVLVVDEAGLLSTKDLLALVEFAHAHRGRLVLSGDTRQHTGIEAGDALRLLEEHSALRLAGLRTIRRQMDQEYRAAIGELAEGQGSEALARLDRLGALHEVGEDERYLRLAGEYIGSLQAGKSALVVSPTWREIKQVTDEVRTRLKSESLLSREETEMTVHHALKWTGAQKRDLRNYKPTMVLTFHKATKGFSAGEWAEVAKVEPAAVSLRKRNGQVVKVTKKQAGCFEVAEQVKLPVAAGERLLIQSNRKADGLFNGQLVAVQEVQRDGRIVLADGRSIAPDFRAFTHGYCVTSHGSQGRTVDHVYVAVDSASMQAAHLNQFYVSASRGRERVKVFTDDLEFLQGAVTRSAARLSATELMESTRVAHREEVKERPAVKVRLAA